MKISDSILYTGVFDTDIDLFEGQYPVPMGVSYNSYVILDEKTALMDTADARVTDAWLANVEKALAGRTPDYLIVSHMEPDHSGSLLAAGRKYPEMKLVMTAKAAGMLAQFGCGELAARVMAVKENDTLNLGAHTLRFLAAPMVHWPEVMVSYEEKEKLLFSADAFGTFGDPESAAWLPEARRYYCNIVGKYGSPVQTLLKKAAGLEIAVLCPLHGPVLRGGLTPYLQKYAAWSSYAPEEKGVLIAYGTLHGNTRKAAEKLAEQLSAAGETVECLDLARTDLSEAVAQAFRFDRVVLACPTYDGGIFPRMEDFIHHLKAKAFQNKTVAFIENGSWAPMAAKQMKALLEGGKGLRFCESAVTLKSAWSDANQPQMDALVRELLGE